MHAKSGLRAVFSACMIIVRTRAIADVIRLGEMRYGIRSLLVATAIVALVSFVYRRTIPYTGYAKTSESVDLPDLPAEATEITFNFSGERLGHYTYNRYEFTISEPAFKNWASQFKELQLQNDPSNIWRYDYEANTRIEVPNGYVYAYNNDFPLQRYITKRLVFDKSTNRGYYYYYEQSMIAWLFD